MPSHKRHLETSSPPSSPQPPLEEEKADDSLQGSDNQNQRETENNSDSEESPYSSDGEKEEYVLVKLAELRKEVQCPICLGIIRKTRTVMECLHRFCRECIDKSMRLGNNECPACRTHCASRRSLRDDPNYDALIATLYPDIDKYEEEELAIHEEEKALNQQIQASITQTFRRQAEALGKKRTSARVAAGAFRRQSYRTSGGRRNHRVVEHQESDEEDGASKDSSSADERSAEAKPRRYKKWGGNRTSQQSSGANADGGCDDTELEANRELVGSSSGQIEGIESLTWGRGGLRSHSRHGGIGWAGGKISKGDRLRKLIDHLQGINQNEEVNVSLTLVSLLEDKIPSLIRPYLCCSPRSTVGHLCEYVARQTSMKASEIEILMVKDYHPVNNSSSFTNRIGVENPSHNELQLLNKLRLLIEHQTSGEIHASSTEQKNLLKDYHPVNNSSSFTNKLGVVNPSDNPSHNELLLLNELQLLNEHQTLGEIHGSSTEQKNLVLAYRQKVQSQGD